MAVLGPSRLQLGTQIGFIFLLRNNSVPNLLIDGLNWDRRLATL